jgi:hypothetical protein
MEEIKFIPFTQLADQIMDEPRPSGKFIPEWYKKMSTYITDKPICKMHDAKQSNLTVKACIPVLDAMTAGYMVTLNSDIIVTRDPSYPHRILWDVSWAVVSEHSEKQYSEMIAPAGYERDPYKWEGFFAIQTPPGYSCYFTHPTNRFDLPFITLTGIVDTDNYKLPVNFPFFLKDDFEGIIPKGTPIAQVIPIKREEWTSTKVSFDPRVRNWIDDLKSVIFRSYKNRFWNKKSYK